MSGLTIVLELVQARRNKRRRASVTTLSCKEIWDGATDAPGS